MAAVPARMRAKGKKEKVLERVRSVFTSFNDRLVRVTSMSTIKDSWCRRARLGGGDTPSEILSMRVSETAIDTHVTERQAISNSGC